MYGGVAARALHVLAVVLWIGGVSLITTVALPAVRRRELAIRPSVQHGHGELRRDAA